jgi:hypothetical protein
MNGRRAIESLHFSLNPEEEKEISSRSSPTCWARILSASCLPQRSYKSSTTKPVAQVVDSPIDVESKLLQQATQSGGNPGTSWRLAAYATREKRQNPAPMHLEKSKMMPAHRLQHLAHSVSGLHGQLIAAQESTSTLAERTSRTNPSKPLTFLACGAVPDQVGRSDLHFSHLNLWCWLPLGWGADVISGNRQVHSPRDADQPPIQTGG